MTHGVDNDDLDEAVAVPGMFPAFDMNKMEIDPNGDYVRLKQGDELEDGLGGAQARNLMKEYSSPPSSSYSSDVSMVCGCNFSKLSLSVWWWTKLILLVTFLGVLGAVSFEWVGPFVMDKVIIPSLNWETKTFSKLELAVFVVASVSIFPTIFLPSSPSMWVAGMVFGYGYGFLLVIGSASIGVSLPYIISSLFHHKIQGLLEKYPKRASVIKLAGEGNWFNQFRAVALIRISPFPYMIYNYCAFATDVRYLPYLFGSLAGMVPEIFLTLYTGIIIKTLADATQDHRFMSAPQIIFNVMGFCATMSTTVLVTSYAKGRLQKLHKEEEAILLH